jgi:hypothetical protein
VGATSSIANGRLDGVWSTRGGVLLRGGRTDRSKEDEMTNVWNYRESVVRDKSSILGYDVDAIDGSIGKITDDAIYVDASHIVVDTGFWIFDKKRIMPASVITGIDHGDETVHVGLTKAEVKDAPDYVPESRLDTDHDYRNGVEVYFRPWTR